MTADSNILPATGDLNEESTNLRIRKALRQRSDRLEAGDSIVVAASDLDEELAGLPSP